MVCHHRSWTVYTVGERQERHAIMALVRKKLSKDVGLDKQSSPLNNIDRVEYCRVWYTIIALGEHT